MSIFWMLRVCQVYSPAHLGRVWLPNFNHYVWDAVAVYNESIHVLIMSIAPPLYIQTILALVSLCFTLRFKVLYIY